MSRLLLIVLLFAAAGAARAQSCGDTITRDLTLTADLHCTTGYTALEIGASGITIDLNGHTLSGARALSGININSASSVRIVNGAITGFWIGVNGLRAHELRLQNVRLIDLDAGVVLNHTRGAEIVDNDFRYIGGLAVSFSVPSAGYGDAGWHYVGYNRFYKIGTGIELCGYENGNSKIVGNEMDAIVDYGIHLMSSSNNTIDGNGFSRIENTGIVLRGSRSNDIVGNVMRNGRLGIAMTPQFGGCQTGPLTSPVVRDNFVEGNSLLKLDTGLSLGLGISHDPWVYKNVIRGNKIYDDGTGIYFRYDAQYNYAGGNAYQGTLTPIVDHGYRNRY